MSVGLQDSLTVRGCSQVPSPYPWQPLLPAEIGFAALKVDVRRLSATWELCPSLTSTKCALPRPKLSLTDVIACVVDTAGLDRTIACHLGLAFLALEELQRQGHRRVTGAASREDPFVASWEMLGLLVAEPTALFWSS
jgi:hypothetical protein